MGRVNSDVHFFFRTARTGNHQLLQEGNEQQTNPRIVKNKVWP